jgi:hypothetical protein
MAMGCSRVPRARVRFSGDKRTVIDGPFAETKESVAGYWILQCKSLAEAIEWIKRCPNPHNEDGEIEIRQLFELEDAKMAMRRCLLQSTALTDRQSLTVKFWARAWKGCFLSKSTCNRLA